LTINEETQTWMSLLRSFNSRLRRFALLGIGLFVIVCADWHFHADYLRQKAEFTSEVLSGFLLNEQFRHEAIQASKESKYPLGAMVRLESLPQLNRAVSQKLRDKFQEQEKKLGSFVLPVVAYRLAIVYAPLILLLGSIVSILQVRRLHDILGPFASSRADVQLALNSPFFDRVTLAYGEKRWRHFWAVAFVHLPIVMSSIIYIPSVIVPVIDPKIFITSIGYLPPAPDLLYGYRGDQWGIIWVLIITITITLWLILCLLGTNPWYISSGNAAKTDDSLKEE
jgi:hypothetical protein